MEGSSLQLNPSTGLMGFLRHWMVSMHDDLRRTGHWLKASSWRWLHEISISSKLLLVQSGGCICPYHMWPCSSCTVQRVVMTKWYDFDIASAILMVGSCWYWCESLFTYYTIVPVTFGGSVQKFMSGSYGRSGDVRLYCCVIYGWVWGQSIMLLCHRWCVFSSLHLFMVLNHWLLYHRDQRFLSAVVLNLRRCRAVSSHYSLLSPSSKHCTRSMSAPTFAHIKTKH